jgi:hypothetical protein
VWYFTVPHTAAGVGASMLSELLLHGLDLARARERPWPITRPQAVAALRGVLPAVVLIVDPASPRPPPARTTCACATATTGPCGYTGACATDFTKGLSYPATRTAAQGAEIAVRLATIGADGPTGGFFDDDGPVPW